MVTTLFDTVTFAPQRTQAYVCGPEVMMRLSARALGERGIPDRSIAVSMERNMRCGVGLCGHCQLGPALVCRDGPVVDYAAARRLFATVEL